MVVFTDTPTLQASPILLACPGTPPFASFYLILGGYSSGTSPAGALSNHGGFSPVHGSGHSLAQGRRGEEQKEPSGPKPDPAPAPA